MTKAWERLRINTIARMKCLRTNEFVCSTISYVLKMIINNEDINLDKERYEPEDEQNLLPVIVGQKEIRWENMLKGFLHKG